MSLIIFKGHQITWYHSSLKVTKNIYKTLEAPLYFSQLSLTSTICFLLSWIIEFRYKKLWTGTELPRKGSWRFCSGLVPIMAVLFKGSGLTVQTVWAIFFLGFVVHLHILMSKESHNDSIPSPVSEGTP